MNYLGVWLFVIGRRRRRVSTGYGGNLDAPADSVPEYGYQAVREAGKRAAQYEDEDAGEGTYPHAHTRDDSGEVVLTFGQGHDWIRADENDVVEVEQ